MIKAYSKSQNIVAALKTFEVMLERQKLQRGVAPNIISYNSIIDCCVRCNQLEKAK